MRMGYYPAPGIALVFESDGQMVKAVYSFRAIVRPKANPQPGPWRPPTRPG